MNKLPSLVELYYQTLNFNKVMHELKLKMKKKYEINKIIKN